MQTGSVALLVRWLKGQIKGSVSKPRARITSHSTGLRYAQPVNSSVRPKEKTVQILKLLVVLYLISFFAVANSFFLHGIPVESAEYWNKIQEANNGFDIIGGIAFWVFVVAKIAGFLGVLILLANRSLGKWIFIIGETISFGCAYRFALPQYIPGIYTNEFIVLLALNFFLFGLIVAISIGLKVRASNSGVA